MPNAQRVADGYFEAMFARCDDPWGYRSRWYEQRKRALTMACLPARRYKSAYEPACAIGELSVALAERCDRLLISDGTDAAVAAATARVRGLSHVSVLRAWIPDEWPGESFDLIVLSEFAYYLDAASLETLVCKTRSSLIRGGTVLACHWRHPIEGCAFDGDQVHRRLALGLDVPRLCHVEEPDLQIDVWCADACTPAQRDGLV